MVFSAVAQQQVTLQPLKDNTLYETVDGSTSNGSGEYLFIGRVGGTGGGTKRRVLIKFDVAGAIPAGATITSVKLTMNMSKTIAGATPVTLNKVNADWGEGTSNAGANEGKGAPATTGDATWLHRIFNSTMWTNAGGDYGYGVSASLSVDGIRSYTWLSTSQLVVDVQGWLTNPSSNFGWIIIGDESSASTAKRFDSRENATLSKRPSLIITYVASTSVENNITIAKYSLKQNYPNPFNPETTIEYELSSPGEVRLEIFNIIGMKIATLTATSQAEGIHSYVWNGSAVPSGIYYYRLEVLNGKNSQESYADVKRMILMR
jgi:hypothetical protein